MGFSPLVGDDGHFQRICGAFVGLVPHERKRLGALGRRHSRRVVHPSRGSLDQVFIVEQLTDPLVG